MLTFHAAAFFVGLVFLFLAALNISHPRMNFGWLGMFFWALSLIIPR